ncbi:MAG: hypothetical protein IKK24_05300 [Clostridia bacterium]|nr:hypothetical protein [Clostridia bacterium]
MTNEELHAVIENALFVDEGIADGNFKSNKRAEYLERAIYVCPYCGLSEFESHGNEIECKKCNKKITYGTDKRLSGVGFDFPFEFVTKWYDYQKEYVCSLDVTQYTDTPIYRDKADFIEVIVFKNKNRLKENAKICLYGDRIVIDEDRADSVIFKFDELSAVTVLGKNKLNIYYNDSVYQLKGSKRFNALKYVNIFYRYKNISRGDLNGKFLGL